MSWHSTLNPSPLMAFPTAEQALAINCPVNDHCIVRAGPGSGKTLFLVHRVLNLVRDTQERMHCFTFTNESARELKRRLAGFSIVGNRVAVSTIHKFCLNGLSSIETGKLTVVKNKNRLMANLRRLIIDSNLITRVGAVVGSARNVSEDVPDENEDDLGTIEPGQKSFLSNLLDAIRHFKKTGECCIERSVMSEIVDLYMHELRDNGQIDISLIVSEFLANFDKLTLYIASTGRYLLVDEFQDLDSEQLKLVQLLIQTSAKTLTAVGDVNQSIYGWRQGGKRIRMQSSLSESNHQLFSFTLNLRSCEAIVRISNRLVDANNVAARDGGFARTLRCRTEMDELYKVVHILKNMSQVKMRDTAVLFRMNCDKERFIKMLDKEGIVYHGKSILNGTAVSVIKHSKSLDTVLMMAAAVVGEEDDSVISGLLLCSSGKKSQHSKLVSFLQGEGLFSVDAQFIPNHEKVVHRLRTLVASKSANITCKSLIGEYLSKLHKIAKQNGVAQQFSSIMKEFKIQKTKDISEFLEFVAQSADLADGLKNFHAHEKLEIEMKNTARGVFVGTIHSAKGREWRTVILPLVDEGVIPSERTDIEEERRVLYVAITRAIESVVLTCSSKPSPFFADLGIKSTFSVNEVTDGLCNLFN